MATPIGFTDSDRRQLEERIRQLETRATGNNLGGRREEIRAQREKQVRIARTVANDFAYPSGASSKYEIELGTPGFDKTSLAGGVTFTPYAHSERYRVAGMLTEESIDEGTLVYVRLCHGKWWIVQSGVSVDLVVFEITDANGYTAATAPTEDGLACVDGGGPMDELFAEIIHMPCGSTSVPLMEDGCKIPLTDPVGWTDDRTPDELIGKRGIAAYVSSDACYADSYTNCQWVIVSIDLFRERLVVVDWIKEEDRIVVKFEKIKVWDHCTEEDYILDLLDCTDSNPYGCV